VSSFTVGVTVASFTANMDNFNERRDTLLRTWDLELFLPLATDYTTLASLFSAPYHIATCPGVVGVTYYVDIGGGAGAGTLVLDNVVGSPFSAALVRMERPSAYPGGGRRVKATFQECPP
jgi:hypothetical protein